MSFNKVIMVGRLCADPEMKQVSGGTSVTSFSIALNRGEGKVDFFTVVAWQHTAEFICKYFKKGDGICIDGHLSSRTYEKDGSKRTKYAVVCDNAGFPEGRKADGGNEARSYGPPRFEEVSTDDDIPF